MNMYAVDIVFMKPPKSMFDRHVSEFRVRNFIIRRYLIDDGFVALLEFLQEMYYHKLSVARIYDRKSKKNIVDEYPREY